MAYKWKLNGCEIRYLSKPKPIQYQSNTNHKIISKDKLVSFSFVPSADGTKSTRNKW